MRLPIPKPRLLRPGTLLLLALTIGLVVLFLRPILFVDGWPQNHEGLRNFHRTAIYAAHLERGDLVPLWSDSVVLGYGGPFPVYYHRLIYYFSGGFHLLGGSLKASLLLSIGIFAAVGLWGMQRLMTHIWPLHPMGVLLAASAGIFNNYSYTLWVVRGAIAEFAAMMLLPWGILWCVRLLEGQSPAKLLLSGILLFPLLYLAHSVIFFYFAAPVLVCVGYALWQRVDRRPLIGALLGIGFAFSLVALPTLYLQHLLGDGFGFIDGISIYQPQDDFRPLASYLWNGEYQWGVNWTGVSVELDSPALLATVFFLSVSSIAWIRRAWIKTTPMADSPAFRAIEILLIGMLGYYIFWQTPAANPFYASVPGFALIQFPWRLLSYLSLLLPLLAWCALSRLRPHMDKSKWAWSIGLACASVCFLGSPWTAPFQSETFSNEKISEAYTGYTAVKVGDAEYTPLIKNLSGPERLAKLRSFAPRPWHRIWEGKGYAVERIDALEFEGGLRTYRIQASKEAVVAFPTAYSPYIRVTARRNGLETPLAAYRTDEDPRLQLHFEPGEHIVDLRYPTIWNLLAPQGPSALSFRGR